MTDEVVPEVQSYVIAWAEAQRASDRWIEEQRRLSQSIEPAREALSERGGSMEVELLTGARYGLSIAPNGRDLIVVPL